MLGEYAVKSSAGEWLIFRVSEEYARKVLRKQGAGTLWKVEGPAFQPTLLETR